MEVLWLRYEEAAVAIPTARVERVAPAGEPASGSHEVRSLASRLHLTSPSEFSRVLWTRTSAAFETEALETSAAMEIEAVADSELLVMPSFLAEVWADLGVARLICQEGRVSLLMFSAQGEPPSEARAAAGEVA